MKVSLRDTSKYQIISKNDLAAWRKKWHDDQKGICPILGIPVPFESTVVDHKHKAKSAGIDHDGNGGGLIRGVIHKNANQLEGQIRKYFKRYGLDKVVSVSDFLRNLAAYLENPPLGRKYIHPNEAPKPKPRYLTKSEYNLIVKYWRFIEPKKNIPAFIHRKEKTVQWDKWLGIAQEQHKKSKSNKKK